MRLPHIAAQLSDVAKTDAKSSFYSINWQFRAEEKLIWQRQVSSSLNIRLDTSRWHKSTEQQAGTVMPNSNLPPCVSESTVGRKQPLKAQGLRDLGHCFAYNWLFSAHRVFRHGGKEVIPVGRKRQWERKDSRNFDLKQCLVG